MDITARVCTPSPDAGSARDAGNVPFALGPKVLGLLNAPTPRGWQTTGLARGHYLDVMERMVRGAAPWVNACGHVIDPILGTEVGQTTPRFVSPGAILLHFGRIPDLRDTVFRTMDCACRALASGQAGNHSPDFWMRELATAYLALEDVAGVEPLARWGADLAAVEPEKIYTRVSPDGADLATLGNWAIYAAAGEAMREAAGLKPVRPCLWGHAFFERYVGAQLACFTDSGMYRDPGDPITYDVTTRLQIACGLAFGYRGKHRAALDDLLRRGALTTLLFASPEGFCPYGGRSGAFHFREAILAALCELEARRYRTSHPRLAGAFKRQAHLSFRSVRRWLVDMEPWRHLKNGFPPAARHGVDAYGNYSVYSLLAASFFGLAAVYADDTIAEAPCPAEIGGFAFALTPAFHKVFATVQGTSVEIDTAADPCYDATGLGCFAVAGVPPELGLAMPFASPRLKWGAPAIAMAPGCSQPATPAAIGPAWHTAGTWVSLAGLSAGLTAHCTVAAETAAAVRFAVAYTHALGDVVEEYLLERGRLSITTRVSVNGCPVPGLRFTVPLLVTDGDSESVISGPAGGQVRVEYLGHIYEVGFGAHVQAWMAAPDYANRNGIYRSLVLQVPAAEVRVTLALTPKGGA